jgi:hypothetical protein
LFHFFYLHSLMESIFMISLFLFLFISWLYIILYFRIYMFELVLYLFVFVFVTVHVWMMQNPRYADEPWYWAKQSFLNKLLKHFFYPFLSYNSRIFMCPDLS